MSFQQIQSSFIDYIRDPSHPLPVDTDTRHMQVYRELFFNNVEGFVGNAMPVLKSLYEEPDWLALVQTFFAEHDCRTPIFVEIAGEFLDFLVNEYEPGSADPPFMLELAHYEYLELQVAVTRDNPVFVRLDIIAAQDRLVLSPLARVAQYAYEVQHIGPDYRPTEPASQPQYFCVYRDDMHEVEFLSLAPLTAQVLNVLADGRGWQISELTEWCKANFPSLDVSMIEQGILPLLTQMAQKGIIRKLIA
ncbi:HvfC family RiPP maturation protein [Shewanella sp. GXUN23E]|uniref:HvfC family RiPP maturation protein n=1 Tax=Shewanella sp. GXUN23E TaxID=3422498 RepID=UPI003D7E624D